MKNLIKLWLIVLSTSAGAANLYRFGYFDDIKSAPLKVETIHEWLRDGLRSGGVKGSVQVQVKAITPQSSDADLKSLDFLILRADLTPARAMAERFRDLGGLIAVSDRWTREDLGVEKFGVLSVSLPPEKRIGPLLHWLNVQVASTKTGKRAAYLTQGDSDFDKIWYFEMAKAPAAKGWTWQEIVVGKPHTKIDFTQFKASENFLVLNRMDSEVLAALTGALHLPSNIVSAVDPFLEKPNDRVEDYFKKNVMTFYLTVYPKDLTNEARDFAKIHKDALAPDAMLHDALMLAGKAMARSAPRLNTRANFFGALDGLSIHGVTGEIKIDRSQVWREIFMVGQRGESRVLDWRSGLVK